MTSHRRGPWSQSEDAYLCQLVHTQGALNWVRIAQLIGSRSPKQCRERYHQNLKPTLNHDPISSEEGLQIERMVAEMGKRWAEIARRLHGRSDNAVKNWWNGSMNRRRRLVLRRKTPLAHASRTEDNEPYLAVPEPAPTRPYLVTANDFTPHRCMDGSLPSPAVSEASQVESIDGAPSLVSDASSSFSISPRLGASPGVELPPLDYHARDLRRPSLPGVMLSSSMFFAETENLTFGPISRKSLEVKPHIASTISNQYPSAQHYLLHHYPSPMQEREGDLDSRGLPPQAHFNPLVLPPLQARSRLETTAPPARRDSRMRLSSLLE